MLTLLLEALDQTVVGTALPKIIAELNGFSLYTWVATAYLIASALVIPIVGKLSDQRLNLDLGPDVDAAGRFVED